MSWDDVVKAIQWMDEATKFSNAKERETVENLALLSIAASLIAIAEAVTPLDDRLTQR